MKECATILIADDDRLVRAMMTDLLSARGYRVVAVNNGAEAVMAHRREAPDVVILDVMMPGMNGHAACCEIRKIDASVPILFFTAYDGETEELEGLGFGADDFLSKTASEERICARIAAALRRVRGAETGNFSFGRGFVDAAACAYREDGAANAVLTEREVFLLRTFAHHANEVLSKDWLLTKLFGATYEGDPRVIDKILERVRGKLGRSAATLVTVPRQGVVYRPVNNSIRAEPRKYPSFRSVRKLLQ